MTIADARIVDANLSTLPARSAPALTALRWRRQPISERSDRAFSSTLRTRHRLHMLRCNMKTEELRSSLEDVLADLWHARRNHDLGRLALLSYCDMRRWARVARREGLAQRSHQLVLNCPHASRE